MTISLAVGATVLPLHDDLFWSDEHNWQPVEQTEARSVTGALLISTSLRVAGRPITLEPIDDQSAWMSHADVVQLRNWAAVPGQEMSLTIRGVSRTVIGRHQSGPMLEATPVAHYSDVASGDWYRVTLRLQEI